MRWPFAILALAFLVLAGLRVLAPEDLFQGDQEKPVGYVMDILHGGRLAIQYEVNGRIATKPPLYNWCAAAACLATGSTAPWVMKLPGLLAGAGIVALMCLLARRLLGGSFLTKGPVGPALYGVWLALWAWHQGTWKDVRRWLALGASVGGVALAARSGWGMPFLAAAAGTLGTGAAWLLAHRRPRGALAATSLALAGTLAQGRPAPLWVLAGKPLPGGLADGPGRVLVPGGALTVKGQGLDVTLYHVEATGPEPEP